MIFIDANKYMEFYNGGNVKKLLDSVLELKEEIFVTQQIVDEVARNKLKVVNNNLRSYLKLENFSVSVSLPDILDTDDSQAVQQWNKDKNDFNKNLKQNFEKLKADLSEITHSILQNVMAGKDTASVKLKEVFDRAVPPSAIEVKNARLRKERGNPPGKPTDPLGDQLSWEQLLSSLNNTQALWIITGDSDYISTCGATITLNAYLYQELKNRGVNAVYCFDKLADGLKHFDENGPKKIKNLPSQEVLKEIADSESISLAAVAQVGFATNAYLATTGHPGIAPTIYNSIPKSCPYCHKTDCFTGEVLRPSQIFGGFTYQSMCKHCNKWVDSGMDYY